MRNVRIRRFEASDKAVSDCVSKQIDKFIYAVGTLDRLVTRDLSSIDPPQGIVSVQPHAFLTNGNVGPNAVLDRDREVGF